MIIIFIAIDMEIHKKHGNTIEFWELNIYGATDLGI